MADAVQFFFLAALTFILALGLVVFVHEFGHFGAARLCRIAVKSFSIGFGPALAARKDRHNTTWKLSAIPLGGYVSFVDDTDPSSLGPASAEFRELSPAEARARGHLRAQPAGARAFVFAAGPAMNFVFAILVFSAILFAFGRDMTDVRTLSPRVDALTVGYPAEKAGVRPGDLIVSVAGQPVRTFGDMQDLITPRPNQPTEIVVRRGGEEIRLTASPRREEDTDATGITRQVGKLGISRGADAHERRVERYNAIEAVAEGAKETWSVVQRTGAYVANIFTGKASAKHISGPIGIFTASGQVAQAAVSGPQEVSIGERIASFFYTLIKWAAYLSVAVGIVNLLPIPILDGGHLLFCAIEAARRGRPLPPQAQEWALRVGLLALGSLFLFATWNDIRRILG